MASKKARPSPELMKALTVLLKGTEYEMLSAEIMSDPVAHAAAEENRLRAMLGKVMDAARVKRKLGVPALAKILGISISHVRHLLHHAVGGDLTLFTIVRAAQALDLEVDLKVRPRRIT